MGFRVNCLINYNEPEVTQDADAASDTAFGSLTNIQADANSDSCDLEMFIASV